MTPEPSPLPKLRALNALRFWAAVAVFVSHLGYLRGFPVVGEVQGLLLSRGHAGVTFFFILSGFILAYAYHDRLLASGVSRATALKQFFIARFARIYPVHALTLAVAVVMGGAEKLSNHLAELVVSTLLLHSWLPIRPFHPVFNGPSWSLAHEAFFYALFPFLLPFFLNTTRAMGVTVVAGLFAGLVCLACLWPSTSIFLFMYFPPARLAEFMTGIVLFRLHRDRVGSGFQAAGGGTRATLTEVMCLALIILTAISAYYVPRNLEWSLLYVPAFALTIFVFASEGGAVSRWLSRPLWFHLGEVSYSFYMFHLMILTVAYWHRSTLGPYGMALAAFAATLAVSLLCYRYFELPMRAKINAWLTDKRDRPVLSPSPELHAERPSPP